MIKPRSAADAELSHYLTALGFTTTPHMIERWRRDGLGPVAARVYAGRGRGAPAHYTPGERDHYRFVAQLGNRGLSHHAIGFTLHLFHRPIADRYVRDHWIAFLDELLGKRPRGVEAATCAVVGRTRAERRVSQGTAEHTACRERRRAAEDDGWDIVERRAAHVLEAVEHHPVGRTLLRRLGQHRDGAGEARGDWLDAIAGQYATLWWGQEIDPVVAEDVLRAWGFPEAAFAVEPLAEEPSLVTLLRRLLSECTIERLYEEISTAPSVALRSACDSAQRVVGLARAFSDVVEVVFPTGVDSALCTVAQAGAPEAVAAIMAAQFLVFADADPTMREALLGEVAPEWRRDLILWDQAAHVVKRIPDDSLTRVRSGLTCWCEGVQVEDRAAVWAVVRQVCGSAPRIPVTRTVCCRAACLRWRTMAGGHDPYRASQVA
jgi:hypothetical protein